MSNQHNDLTEILSQALNEIKSEMGDQFSLEKNNLAELERRTGISRARLRHIKENGFTVQPHALIGRKANTTVLTGFTGMIDALLRRGVKNSSVIFDRLIENGYTGGKTSVKSESISISYRPNARWLHHVVTAVADMRLPPESAIRWIGALSMSRQLLVIRIRLHVLQ